MASDYFGDIGDDENAMLQKHRDDARQRVLDTISRGSQAYGQGLKTHVKMGQMDQALADKQGAASPLLMGLGIGSMFGPVGAAVGGGLGLLGSISKVRGANRKAGVHQGLLGSLGDIVDPGNLLKNPGLLPAVAGLHGLAGPAEGALAGSQAGVSGAPLGDYASQLQMDPSLGEGLSQDFQFGGGEENPFQLGMGGRKGGFRF